MPSDIPIRPSAASVSRRRRRCRSWSGASVGVLVLVLALAGCAEARTGSAAPAGDLTAVVAGVSAEIETFEGVETVEAGYVRPDGGQTWVVTLYVRTEGPVDADGFAGLAEDVRAAVARGDVSVTWRVWLADEVLAVQVLPVADVDEVVRLAVETAARPSVTAVWLLVDETGTALTVEVDDDDAAADVAAHLTAAPDARDRGRPVRYEVRSPAGSVGGYVSDLTHEDVVEEGPAPTEPVPEVLLSDRPTGTPDPALCTGDELAVEIRGIDAALGSRFMLLAATNITDRECVVEARPTLAFRRASGTMTPNVTLVPRSIGPTVPERVSLIPGDTVLAEVKWGAMSTSLDSDQTVVVLVSPVPGAESFELPVASWSPAKADDMGGVGPTELDILDGATVEVGPWQSGNEGWND
ncbi:DUF4232 domain-containing protein [Cellulomonas sp. P22]|uniref:DUF4232 domain-containing protein n=1 Tax=Cellulomonas sp. P22 TaxID=3373189 RepID=UPI0037A54FB1